MAGRPIRELVERTREAASRVRDARQDVAVATDDATNDAAMEKLEAAMADFVKANIELNQRSGEAVGEDGVLSDRLPEGITAADVGTGLSAEAIARMKLGGIAATADMTPDEVAAAAAAARAEEHQAQVDDIVEKHTGRTAGSVDAETARRALREEALQNTEGTEATESRVIGYDPLDRTDAEIAARLSEHAARVIAAEMAGKDPDDVTAADFEAIRQRGLEAQSELRYGKPLEELTDIERMRLESAIRNEAFDKKLADATATGGGSAGASDGGSSAGGGAGGAGAAVGPGLVSGPVGREPGDGGAAAQKVVGGTGDGAGSTAGVAGKVGGTVSKADAAAAAPAVAPTTPTAPADSGGGAGGSGAGVAGGGGRGEVAAPGATPVTATFKLETGADNVNPTDAEFGTGTDLAFYRTEDGRWFDEAGHEVTGAENIAILEAIFADAMSQAESLGETFTVEEKILPADKSFEDAVKDAKESGGSGGSGGGSGGGSSDSESGGGGDDGDDDGDDGGGDSDVSSDDSAAAEDAPEEADDGGETGGDEGTPHPDQIDLDPAALAAFLDSPLGRSQRQTEERGIEYHRSGGVTDPPEHVEADGGIPVEGNIRFRGGDVDPVDGAVASSGYGPIDEMRIPGAGLIDPADFDGVEGGPEDPSRAPEPTTGEDGGGEDPEDVASSRLSQADLAFGAGAARDTVQSTSSAERLVAGDVSMEPSAFDRDASDGTAAGRNTGAEAFDQYSVVDELAVASAIDHADVSAKLAQAASGLADKIDAAAISDQIVDQ